MPSAHSINFPDDPDPLARYRREDEQQKEEFARQRAREERVQQSKVQTMDSDTQSKWDTWADNRIEAAWRHHMDVVGDALGETMQKFDAKIAKVRQEMRDSPPPLFAAPDKATASSWPRRASGVRCRSQQRGRPDRSVWPLPVPSFRGRSRHRERRRLDGNCTHQVTAAPTARTAEAPVPRRMLSGRPRQ
jgi:hypothetical protein